MNTLRFVNAVRGWKVTALISAETVPSSEQEIPHTISGVESFADGFIHLSYLRRAGKRERAVEIVKMRGASHVHDIVPAQITIFEDRSFKFILKTPPAAALLKKAAASEKSPGLRSYMLNIAHVLEMQADNNAAPVPAAAAPAAHPAPAAAGTTTAPQAANAAPKH